MAYLEIKSGTGVSLVMLGEQSVSIGRDAENAIVIDDVEISRRHCIVQSWDDGYHVLDLGSRNGTRVNGEPLGRHALSDNDVIRIGGAEMRFIIELPQSNNGARNRRIGPVAAVAGLALLVVFLSWWGGLFGSNPSSRSLRDNPMLSIPLASDAPEVTPQPSDFLMFTSRGYVEISSESNGDELESLVDKYVTAPFYGTATKSESGKLLWELPPRGDVVAIIEPGTPVYDALANEPMLLEVELFGRLFRGSSNRLELRVGEVRIKRAWVGNDDDLQPATESLLDRSVVIDASYTAPAGTASTE